MLFPATEQNQATSAKNIGDSLGCFQEKECGTTTVITVYMAILMLLTSLQNPILGFLPNSLQPLGLIPSHARNPLKRQRRRFHELVLHRLCNLPARPSFEIVNDWLVVLTILKPSWKIWVRQWEGWHPIYEMENKTHVWNHQPGTYHGNTLGISMGKIFETSNQLVKPTS